MSTDAAEAEGSAEGSGFSPAMQALLDRHHKRSEEIYQEALDETAGIARKQMELIVNAAVVHTPGQRLKRIGELFDAAKGGSDGEDNGAAGEAGGAAE